MVAQANLAQRGTILFVDDEPRVLTSMRAAFRRDYVVLIASSGEEALAMLRAHDVDVIVSDQRMPGMSGVELLRAVSALAPRAMRILLTGYADLKAIEASINEGEVFRYLTKPCPTDVLRDAIALAVEAARNTVASALPAAPRPKPVPAAAAPAPTVADEYELFEIVPAGVQPSVRTARNVQAPPARPPIDVAVPASAPAPVKTLPPAPLPAHRVEPAPRAEVAVRAEVEPAAASTLVVPTRARADGRSRRVKSGVREVDLLALTTDPELLAVLDVALAGSHRLHRARTLEQALEVLEHHPVGVLVTDMASRQAEIEHLTTELKLRIPDLVTIVASDRSDAQLLIDLINYGQIFRFLLKPVQAGRCRLSIEAAIARHRAMAADPALAMRHSVVAKPGQAKNTSVVNHVLDRVRRLRARFFATGGVA